MNKYIYIYIYIERERERERGGEIICFIPGLAHIFATLPRGVHGHYTTWSISMNADDLVMQVRASVDMLLT